MLLMLLLSAVPDPASVVAAPDADVDGASAVTTICLQLLCRAMVGYSKGWCV